MKTPKSLLEKAKEVPVNARGNTKITDDGIELALAWLNDEVGLMQVKGVLGIKRTSTSSVYSWLVIHIREAYRQNKIVIKE